MAATRGTESTQSPAVPAPIPPDDPDAWYAPDVRSQDEIYPGVVVMARHFVTTDAETGYLAVEPKMTERQAELRIARFEKVGSLTATDVRDRLDDALPGESRTPTRLSRISVVNAEPTRHSRETTGSAGVAKYYTDQDADQVNDLNLMPAIYQLREVSRDGDRTRPLTPALSELGELLPGLARGAPDLIMTVKFVGQERERTEFQAREVVDK